MKILLYNFVQFDDAEKRGGGVTVYLNNLTNYLLEKGHEVYFLSSGMCYDLLNDEPRLEVIKQEKLTRCIIYNSPFLAPANTSFYRPDIFSNNSSLSKIAEEIYRNFPDLQVFHFNNIEGLTYNFIYILRKYFNKSKFIYSVHNYNLVCMQVNLWFNDNQNCIDYDRGKKCLICTYEPDNYKNIKRIKKIQTILQRKILVNRNYNHSKLYVNAKNLLKFYRINKQLLSKKIPVKIIEEYQTNNKEKYVIFRENNIDMCNQIFDEIISVSKRTQDIMESYGIHSQKSKKLYIGTKFYRQYKNIEKKTDFNDCLSIGYLGYIRKDKGFNFFIESILRLPSEIKSSLNIIIAAKYNDEFTEIDLRELLKDFNSIGLYDGYSHENLENILSQIDLGVIPVQWEDNLPQVAIELVCNGIPILTSNLGGASEIANNSNFTFDYNSYQDFSLKLNKIIQKKVKLVDFWKEALNIFSIDEHTEKLIEEFYL